MKENYSSVAIVATVVVWISHKERQDVWGRKEPYSTEYFAEEVEDGGLMNGRIECKFLFHWFAFFRELNARYPIGLGNSS